MNQQLLEIATAALRSKDGPSNLVMVRSFHEMLRLEVLKLC